MRATTPQFTKKPQNPHKSYRRSLDKSLSPVPGNDTQPRFHPEISKKSLRIAANLGDPKVRLLGKKRDKSEGALGEESHSFRPTINRKSSLLTSMARGHTHNQSERWDFLSSINQSVCDRSYRLLLVEQEELKQCTFQPKVQGSKLAKGNVIQRLETWAKEKEKHIRSAVEDSAGKDLEQCTFMPAILDVKSSPKTKTVYSNGVDKFLERQRRARSQKQEKESKSRSKSPIGVDLEPPTLLNTRQFPPTEECQVIDFEAARSLLHDQLHCL